MCRERWEDACVYGRALGGVHASIGSYGHGMEVSGLEVRIGLLLGCEWAGAGEDGIALRWKPWRPI